jgi:probable addiction module antidote protein
VGAADRIAVFAGDERGRRQYALDAVVNYKLQGRWLIEQLKDPAEAAAYLEAVLEDGDQAAIMLALRREAQVQGGVASVARKAHLTHEATYKMLSKSGNPELRSLSSVLNRYDKLSYFRGTPWAASKLRSPSTAQR